MRMRHANEIQIHGRRGTYSNHVRLQRIEMK